MKEQVHGKDAAYVLASSGVDFNFKLGSGGWYQVLSPCPACGHKKTLYFHDQSGVFKCQHAGCDLNFKSVNAVDFVMHVTGMSFKEAAGKLIAATGGSCETKKDICDATSYSTDVKLTAAEKNKTACFLMEHMTLQKADREHLRSKKRSLTDDEINLLGYKSYDLKNAESILRLAIKAGCKIEGFPGVFRNKFTHEWDFRVCKAKAKDHSLVNFLIWGKDALGNIFGAQSYNAQADPEKKYLWLSSASFDHGVSCKSQIHYAIDRSVDWENGEVTPILGDTVYLIEGLLKGDICHMKTKKPFLCMAGVTQYTPLKNEFETLKKYGVKEVVTVFDMDYHSNTGVAEALHCVQDLLKAAGFRTRQLEWNNNCKGFDDFIINFPDQIGGVFSQKHDV